MKTNHYETLGISKDADEATIKKAFRKKASKAHPDKGGDAETMAKLNAAWECLGNAQRRLTYDKTGHDGEGATAEDSGRNYLMEAFDRILNSGNSDNVVPRVREVLNGQLSELRQQGVQIEEGKKNLVRARSKVKKKKETPGSIHLYHMLIDKRLHQMEAALVELRHTIQSFEQARQLLEEYESELPTMSTTTSMFQTGGATFFIRRPT